MKQKNSGFTASGLFQPEIRPGDIFRDKYGCVVTVKYIAAGRVYFKREKYPFISCLLIDCFLKTFRREEQAKQKVAKTNASEQLRAIKSMIAARRMKK